MPKGKVEFPSLKEVLEIVPKIHGHVCSASYLGSRMALYAMKHLQLKRKKDLCAAVEILTCAADGIQAATQCSFGSGRLVFLDYGKFAAIFCNWVTGEAIRVKCRESIDKEHIAFGAQLEKFYRMQEGGAAMEELLKERERLDKIEQELIAEWDKMSDEELFEIRKVEVDPKNLQYPLEQQYISSPVKCEKCSDVTEKSRTVEKNGKRLCKVCAGYVSWNA